MMNKLLIICGPTATGKTKLGVELAKKMEGEIVSADSRQVYRGMDIGTGKDVSNFKFQISNFKSILNDKFQMGYYIVDGIRVWLLDIVEPDYRFNVADYKKCAEAAIENIFKRGKLPIVVGGTGFYIKAIIEGIGTMGVEPDWELRAKLSNYKISELQIALERLDPKRCREMNKSDRQNPRRLIRAIEIAQKIPPSSRRLAGLRRTSKTDNLFIGLVAPNEILYQRIDQRVEARVEAGLEEEIRSLLKKGFTWENSALGTTLAYSEWRSYFENQKNKEEVILSWKFDEHGYARRQMTWFKKDPKINWFEITKDGWQTKVEKMVNNWYS